MSKALTQKEIAALPHWGNEDLRSKFRQLAWYLLPHRRKVMEVVSLILDDILGSVQYNCKEYGDYRVPFFTHLKLARVRGRQHRNTTRDIIRELVQVGLINSLGYKRTPNQNCTKFYINWGNITPLYRKYKRGNLKQIKEVRPDSVEAWDEAYASYHERKAAAEERKRLAAEERERKERAEQRRKEKANAATPEQRQNILAKLNPFKKQPPTQSTNTIETLRKQAEMIKNGQIK